MVQLSLMGQIHKWEQTNVGAGVLAPAEAVSNYVSRPSGFASASLFWWVIEPVTSRFIPRQVTRVVFQNVVQVCVVEWK